MKTTIDVPDDIYKQVKAKSALEGMAVREVTVALYRWWLTGAEPTKKEATPEAWLDDWLKLGKRAMKGAPKGPTATEVLEEDRNRLEPR